MAFPLDRTGLLGRWSWLLLLVAGCQPATTPAPNSPPVAATAPATPAAESGKDPAADAPPATPAAEPTPPPAPKPIPDAELAEGWISLFDGESLYGWKPATDANWRVEQGAIVVDSGTPGLLCTTTQFGNYELHCEFRSPAATNSGIFLHTPVKPTDPAKDCYELNIAPQDNPFPTGSLVKRQKTAGAFASEDWQTFDVTVLDGQVVVRVNGQPGVEYQDDKPLRRGFIGLQLNQGRAEFRNIKLKPLGVTSLFNGKDLEGWNEYPQLASKFTVTPEGWINVKDGRGQLETKQSFGDFVAQLECISHAPRLNSGLFFRCIPGEQMNGYECQIHNGTKDGDRKQPQDCGTGGIFRRQNARLVVANDGEWFAMTLIATGNHMAAWVNGYQVSDWTDDRPPHANPRNGRRDEAGTLMLQGHDPTTNLSFRNLRAGEIAGRSE